LRDYQRHHAGPRQLQRSLFPKTATACTTPMSPITDNGSTHVSGCTTAPELKRVKKLPATNGCAARCTGTRSPQLNVQRRLWPIAPFH